MLAVEYLHHLSAVTIQYELEKWYKEMELRDPKHLLYVLHDVTIRATGSRDSPVMRAETAQLGTLVKATRQMHGKLSNGASLHGRCFCAYGTLADHSKSRAAPPPTAHQRLIECAMKPLRLREAAGIRWKPKMHMMAHLVVAARQLGIPLSQGRGIKRAIRANVQSLSRKDV